MCCWNDEVCMNPYCNRPAEMVLEVFGRRVGRVCYICGAFPDEPVGRDT